MHRQIRHRLKLKAEGRLQNCKILHGRFRLQALSRRHEGLLVSLHHTYLVTLSVLSGAVMHGLIRQNAHRIILVIGSVIFDLRLRRGYLRSRLSLTDPGNFSILRMN